jgi:hypothetical protein
VNKPLGHEAPLAEMAVKKFLGVLTLFYVFATSFGILLNSYFSLTNTETLILRANDGWCNSPTEGIGIHCFGDFSAALKLNFATPWTFNPVAYPPLSLAYFRPFAFLLAKYPNQNITLLFHLALMVGALLFPATHLYFTNRVKSKFLALGIGFLCLSSAPGLMALDRGNNQIFILPFLYLFYISIMAGKNSNAVVYGILMTMWRPQMALLGVIFLVIRDWKSVWKWALGSVAGTLLAFGLFPWSDYFVNLKAWFANMFGYQTVQSLPAFAPTNWSFANFVAMLGSFFSSMAHGYIPSPGTNYIFPGKYVGYLSIGFLIVCVVIQMRFGRKNSLLQNLIVASSLAILVPGVTFSYYLVILLVPVIFIAVSSDIAFSSRKIEGSREWTQLRKGVDSLFETRLRRLLLYSTFISILIPWPLPWRLIGIAINKPEGTIGVNWVFGNIFLVLWFTMLLIGNIRVSDILTRKPK